MDKTRQSLERAMGILQETLSTLPPTGYTNLATSGAPLAAPAPPPTEGAEEQQKVEAAPAVAPVVQPTVKVVSTVPEVVGAEYQPKNGRSIVSTVSAHPPKAPSVAPVASTKTKSVVSQTASSTVAPTALPSTAWPDKPQGTARSVVSSAGQATSKAGSVVPKP